MRFLRRSIVAVFLLALTVGLLALAGGTVYGALQERWSQEARQRPARERVFAANVVEVRPERVTPVLETFGEVRARRELDLRTAVGGTVIELAANVEEGGTVEAGQVLVRIDPSDAQTALDVALSDLAEAEAELADARRALELARDELASAETQERLRRQALARQRDLQTRGVGTAAAVESAELALASAEQAVLSRRQAVAQAEARIALAEARLGRREIAVADARRTLADTVIRAEFPGVLADVTVVKGGIVTANERLARIVDPAALEVAFRVSTAQFARLIDERGRLLPAPVTARLDVGGVDLEARGVLSRESATVGEGQTGRRVFARLTEARGFRPGDFVLVRIEEPPLDRVARLPASAVGAGGEVLVLGEDDRLETAAVEVLRRQGDEVIVRPGRALAGREVVAERSPLLGAGIKVRPLRPRTGDEAAAAQQEPEMVELTDERRARLVAFVEGNRRMPAEVKERILGQLAQPKVPAQMVERIESRMGG